MRHFEWRLVEQAVQFAADGGQALHTHQFIVDWKKAPNCFKAAFNRGEDIAHLFDQDEARLVRTVRKLGVKVVVVERAGRRGQHIDLCGGSIKKALALCENAEPITHVRPDGKPWEGEEKELSPLDPGRPQDASGREHGSEVMSRSVMKRRAAQGDRRASQRHLPYVGSTSDDEPTL